MQLKFGRVYKEDPRDENYPVSTVIRSGLPEVDKKRWWADGWHGDQGRTPFCVVYAWSHWFEDGPVIQDVILGRQKPIFPLKEFYDEAQLRDDINRSNYEGTTVRAGAKILHKLGIVEEYRWAFTIDEVIKCVSYLGPMVVGTNWYEQMFTPTSGRHILRPRGRNRGGHAYVINGIDHHNELFRIKNSWGRSWGDDGHAFIRFNEFERLLLERGEACVAFQNKVDQVPDLADLPAP